MGVVTRAKKRKLEEVDRISGLPDGVLDDIVSFLPTKDGARTQLLSSRWRHIWRAAPLNLELHDDCECEPTRLADVSRVLAAHPGPGRRFSVHIDDEDYADAALDGWLRSPAIDNLQELEIHFSSSLLLWGTQSLQLPASVFRFSPTLRAASFKACVFPDGIINRPNWSILEQLTLSSVTISEGSLHALLKGCPVLQSLLLLDNNFCPRYRISSPSLRSIGVRSRHGYEYDDDETDDEPVLLQIVIEDAPCLERLLLFRGVEMDISVVSAPRLAILGKLQGNHRRMIQFGNTSLQRGPSTVSGGLMAVVPSVRILALYYVKPCVVIDLIKCSFPHLETLHVEMTIYGESYASDDEYWNLTGTLDIRLRKIVVLKYRHDYKEYIDFAKFLVMNASVLESMTLELKDGKIGNNAWIRRQHSRLKIEERASRDARFDFVSCVESSSYLLPEKQVHDLSIHDPFQRIY